MTTAEEVIARRRAGRSALLDHAVTWVAAVAPDLDVRAAVVVGSVARGDFHGRSDVDVVVIADRLPADPAERWQRLLPRNGVVSPVAWTPEEWREQLRRRNPLAVDAVDHGVWLTGTAADLEASPEPAGPDQS